MGVGCVCVESAEATGEGGGGVSEWRLGGSWRGWWGGGGAAQLWATVAARMRDDRQKSAQRQKFARGGVGVTRGGGIGRRAPFPHRAVPAERTRSAMPNRNSAYSRVSRAHAPFLHAQAFRATRVLRGDVLLARGAGVGCF